MRRWLVCVTMLCVASVPVAADCLDPKMLAPSTVGITRHFSEEERAAKPDVLGVRGTGWFLTSRLIVTAAHVAEEMHLSASEWSTIQVRERETMQSIPVRLVRILGTYNEKIAILETASRLPGATGLLIRTQPLAPDERVTALGYPSGHLRTAEGRFVEFGSDDRTRGMALLEMHDDNDRLVLDHGASGAPIIDCAGQVVAVVASTFAKSMKFYSHVIRISTPWQSPNIAAVPIASIKDLSRTD